jgi:hypothetical protein
MRPAPSADVSPSGMAVFRLTATGHFHEAADRKGLLFVCLWTRKASAGVAGNGRFVAMFYCHIESDLQQPGALASFRLYLLSLLFPHSDGRDFTRSIGGLLRDEPVLRPSCLFGATGFASPGNRCLKRSGAHRKNSIEKTRRGQYE